jgi:cell division protein FtsL
MKQLIVFIVVLFAFLSCTEKRDFRDALSRAGAIMYHDADSALAILDSLGAHQSEFGSHFQKQYQLQSTAAKMKAGAVFTTDSLTKVLVDYFEANGDDEEAALAYYMYGCSLIDLGQSPEGLQAYYTALSLVDTTKADCNYNLLKNIYGQMSLIFDNQNLPQDEIWALRHYIDNVKRTSSEREYLFECDRLITPYILMDEIDSVLLVSMKSYEALKRIGDNQGAARVLCPTIYYYMARGQMDKAKWAKEIFEKESGWYENGNVASGRESYYYVKGFYDLSSNRLDSAEKSFRKAIQYGYLSEGYRGLLNVYRKRHDVDSVFHFSLLYEAAQDTLHDQIRTNSIHQMSALYNYNRSQKEAEQARETSRKLKMRATFIGIISFFVVVMLFWLYLRYKNKKKYEIQKLLKKLESAISARSEISEELQMLKSKNYEGMIAAKEAKEAELTEIIRRLQQENEQTEHSDASESFVNSPIAQLFIKKSNLKIEKPNPSDGEWSLLIRQFSKCFPILYKSFSEGTPLSQLQQQVCVLIVLGMSDSSIRIMLGNSKSVLSDAKSDANERLFGQKGARSLKSNLFNALR